MKSFEYHRQEMPVDMTVEEALAKMNDLGRQGWELVYLGHAQTIAHVLWFKREL